MGAEYLANHYAPIFIFILIALGMGALPLVTVYYTPLLLPTSDLV